MRELGAVVADLMARLARGKIPLHEERRKGGGYGQLPSFVMRAAERHGSSPGLTPNGALPDTTPPARRRAVGCAGAKGELLAGRLLEDGETGPPIAQRVGRPARNGGDDDGAVHQCTCP